MGYLIGDDMALLHPPKTGGIWARSACQAVGLPWTRYGGKGQWRCQHRDECPPRGRFTMVFVRHPVEWLRSLWMYHQRTGWREYTDSPAFVFYANYRRGETFAQFVARYLDRMPGAIGRMFARYEQYADYIGHTETLAADLARFIGKVHPEIDVAPIATIPRANASSDEQFRATTYAAGQVDAVKRAERDFIKEHGY